MECGKRVKRLVRKAGIAALAVAGFVCAYLLCSLTASFIPLNGAPAASGDIAVYVHSNGVHVDLVLPVQTDVIDWRQVVSPADTKYGVDIGCPYISFGWGSREFYLNVPEWSDLTLGVALRAVLGIGGSSLHTCYEAEPHEGPRCRRVWMDRPSYQALVDYLLAGAQRDGRGRFVPIDTTVRHHSTDAFYVGTGRYSPFQTCNTWSNAALKRAGLPCCLWTPFSFPIISRFPQKDGE